MLAALAVTIAIQPGAESWRASYKFSEPVATLTFARNGSFSRRDWTIDAHGKSATVTFPVDTSYPEKEYQLFQRYSDGGILLYTGHLNPAHVKHPTFALTPRRGEHLIVGGRVDRGRTTWTDRTGQGTFVYYGKTQPVETPNMIAVIDPGMPAWLALRLREDVPKLFADYSRLMGFTLERRPTVLFSFEPARDPNSTTWKGGTLPDLIQMNIEAAAGAKEDRDLLDRFFKFLAHEAAHMWNGQLFRPPEKNQSWMHEGGAEAFAYRAMRRAGLLTDAELTARQTADLNECLAGIGTRALDEAEADGQVRSVYPCGSALGWLTEAAVRRKDPAADLHTFWRAMLHAAPSRTYDETLYLATLGELADPQSVEFIDDFVHRPMPDRLERTVAAFASEGVHLESRPDDMPADAKEQWAQAAIIEVMRGDCGGHYSVSRGRDTLVVYGSAKCATLKSKMDVEAIEGKSVTREGHLAYDAVATRCAASEPVTLGGLSVPCNAALAPRPPWLAVKPERGRPFPRGTHEHALPGGRRSR
jgi:hypothetical protein